MAEHGISGIEIAEQNGADHAIERLPTGITAFVGRTLKGPINQAVTVANLSEFQLTFGGLWQPSTLSYAIEQFFDNGGRAAIVVRVVNGARPPTLSLPAGGNQLRLAGVNPGSREYLRASVDYDGIGENESDRFNLVVQRVRAPGSELIEDQEIFRRLSIGVESGRFVTDVLLESRLVRATGDVPAQRPDPSTSGPGGAAVGYVNSNPDGDDGAPLTDYDVIGSAIDGTGLFALKGSRGFNFLCIPPLAREQDIGSSTLLVAARFCRDQHAMLIVDPPAAWGTAGGALDALPSWPFRSENAVMYFPRVIGFDRLRGRAECFGSAAAAAGMIARADETWPVWAAAESDDSVLRPGLRPASPVTDTERARLAHAGVNTLLAVRPSTPRSGSGPRTLAAGGGAGASEFKFLAARRLALFILASIERGTRWVVFERSGPAAWQSAQRQVEAFLERLDEQHAFAGRTPEETYFVICDERINDADSIAAGRINLLFGFAAARPGDFQAWLVTHQPGSSRVRHVSVNRMATSQRRLEWEIETAILRGLVLEH
ncbi:MAG: phage tail sheath family protein [Steroidobacteraceae bacterium]